MARASYSRPSTLCLQENLALPLLDRKSSSEPDLNATSKDAHQQQFWTSFGRGFPPGLTVDELAMYRRRRPPCHLRPRDNLQLQDGTLMFLKSEYRKRYVPHPLEEVLRDRSRLRLQDSLKLEGDAYLQPEYCDAFVDFPRERPCPSRPQPELATAREPLDAVTVNHSSYVFHKDAPRVKLQRRRTNLRCEGELAVKQSEVHSKFVLLEGARRAELARRKTSLKMEGEMDMLTEKNEKYVTFPTSRNICHPRKQTMSNLKLEGSMEKQTEARSKYVGYSSPERSTPRRRPTSLHLEGEMEKMTENLEKFVTHPKTQRAGLLKRPPSLRMEGDIESRPEYRDFFIDFPRARPVINRPTDTLKQEGDFEAMTEKRAQFVDFLLNHGARTEKIKRPNNLKMEGDCSFNPEYRDCFICFPCERPQIRKQQDNIKQEGNMELFTEQQSKYVGYPDALRPEFRKGITHPNSGSDECENVDYNKQSSSDTNRSDAVNPCVQHEDGKGINLLSAENEMPKYCPITTQPFDSSSEIRPAYIPKFHDSKLAKRPQALIHLGRHTDPNKHQKKFFPPRTGLKESERLLREMLKREKSAVGRRKADAEPLGDAPRTAGSHGRDFYQELVEQQPPSPYRAFQVLDSKKRGLGTDKPDKSVTFDISDSDKRSSEVDDSLEAYRSNSPTFRLLVRPASITDDNYDPVRVRGASLQPSPVNRLHSPGGSSPQQLEQEQGSLRAGKSFLVLDDLNNNDVSSDANGNEASSRSRSAFLDVPDRKGRRGGGGGVNWMPPWYDAPSSI